jgi:UDP-N-acetylglucosamine transferase subunit ALG13
MTDSAAIPPTLPAEAFVFVTVGTDHHRFDRLVDLCEAWAADRGIAVFIQTGTSRPVTPESGAAYLPFATMAEAMAGAEAVVCHGGPATIMLARQCGRTPIVVPRDPAREEHVDGHQQKFARWMADKGQIVLAPEEADLVAHLDEAMAHPDRYRVAEGDATAAAVPEFSRLVNDLVDRRRGRS